MTPEGPDKQQRDRDRVTEEAALWLSRLQLGTADEATFERWRAADPAHALEFARAYAAWEALSDVVTAEDLQTRPDLPTPQVSPTRTDLPPPRVRQAPTPTLSRRRFWQLAGSSAAVALGGALWGSKTYAWSSVETGVGEFRKISLPDTSVVELNTDSAVAWRFDGRRREIRLDRGEIAITLRLGVPALLLGKTPVATLSAGIYNVRCLEDVLRVTVLKGEALLADTADTAGPVKTSRTVVTALQQLTVAPDRSVKIGADGDLDATTAWQNGEIIFRDEPLTEAIAEYNRYLTKKIVIVEPTTGNQTPVRPSIASQRIGGRFTNTDPHSFLNAVSGGLNLRIVETDRQYLITPKI